MTEDDRFCEHGYPRGTRCPQCEGPPEELRGPDLSLGSVFDLITPPGTDGRRLLDSLKSAQRAPAPPARTPSSAQPPADPFTPGGMASAALAEMYSDMVESGIPVSSVEAILGHMLAAGAEGQEGS